MAQKVKCGDPGFVSDSNVRKLKNTLKSRTPSNVKFYSHHKQFNDRINIALSSRTRILFNTVQILCGIIAQI